MSVLESDAVTAATGTNTNLALTGKGTGKVALGDGALTFPDADGSANQPIITNGSAALSFATLPVAGGGTGAVTHTANNVLVGNGTSAIASVAPSTSGNVLTSNGSAWTSAAAAGGAWTLISTQVASDSATLTVTGLDSTYDTYAVAFSDVVPASDSQDVKLLFGDSGGIDTSGYQYHCSTLMGSSSSYNASSNASADYMRMQDAVGNAAGEGFGAMVFIHCPGDGTTRPQVSGTQMSTGASTNLRGGFFAGMHGSVIVLDRVQFAFTSGNIATGRMTVWGIAHA